MKGFTLVPENTRGKIKDSTHLETMFELPLSYKEL